MGNGNYSYRYGVSEQRLETWLLSPRDRPRFEQPHPCPLFRRLRHSHRLDSYRHTPRNRRE